MRSFNTLLAAQTVIDLLKNHRRKLEREVAKHGEEVKDMLLRRGVPGYGVHGVRRVIALALLHDVVEEGIFTFDQIAAMFPVEIEEGLRHLTRKSGEPYFTYINRIRFHGGVTARLVKLADLHVNLQRCRENPKGDLLKRYEKAINILEGRED